MLILLAREFESIPNWNMLIVDLPEHCSMRYIRGADIIIHIEDISLAPKVYELDGQVVKDRNSDSVPYLCKIIFRLYGLKPYLCEILSISVSDQSKIVSELNFLNYHYQISSTIPYTRLR